MGTRTEVPDEAFMHGVPIVAGVTVDMHGGMKPDDPAVVDFVSFIQGFVLNVHSGKTKVYVDETFLVTLVEKLEMAAVVDFKVNVLWKYVVLLNDKGEHHLELSLHPYTYVNPVGYTLQ